MHYVDLLLSQISIDVIESVARITQTSFCRCDIVNFFFLKFAIIIFSCSLKPLLVKINLEVNYCHSKYSLNTKTLQKN